MKPVVLASLLMAVACSGGDFVPRTNTPIADDRINDASHGIAGFAEAGVDSVDASELGAQLLAFREPLLSAAALPRDVAVLRFMFMRSLDHPMVVRIVHEPGRCRAVTTELGETRLTFGPPDSSGVSWLVREDPRLVVRRDSVDVDVNACVVLEEQLADPQLWQREPDDAEIGIDGSTWVFEVVNRSGHRVRSRRSPDTKRHSAMWKAGLSFLRLGKATPADGRVY